MDRFLLEVYCPADAKTYEFWLSKNINAGEAASQIAAEIGEFEQNAELFDRKEDGVRLYCMDDGRALPLSGTLLQAGIRSGYRLMIV